MGAAGRGRGEVMLARRPVGFTERDAEQVREREIVAQRAARVEDRRPAAGVDRAAVADVGADQGGFVFRKDVHARQDQHVQTVKLLQSLPRHDAERDMRAEQAPGGLHGGFGVGVGGVGLADGPRTTERLNLEAVL